MNSIRSFRLVASEFWVDVRLICIDGRWIASADTPHGPSLGLGRYPREALAHSLTWFEPATEELLESVPEILYWG